MKKLVCVLTLLGALAASAQSFTADISLRWKANSPTQFVTKYVIHQAKDSLTNYIPVVTAYGTNVAKVRITSAGTYRYKISAVNGAGTSPLSTNLVQWPTQSPTTPEELNVLSVDVK